MEKKKTVFDYLGSVFMIYGITVTLLIFISYFFGNVGNTMFSLGSEGLSLTLLMQFLFLSFVNVILQYICFSDVIIRDGSHKFRMIVMFISILLIMAFFIKLFGWFSGTDLLPWVMYVVFFIVSSIISILIVLMKEKIENKQMEEGLKRFKKKLKEE